VPSVTFYSDHDPTIGIALKAVFLERISNKSLCYYQATEKSVKKSAGGEVNARNFVVSTIAGSPEARLFEDANLYGVDNYFQLLRRRISVLERPIASASDQKHGQSMLHTTQCMHACWRICSGCTTTTYPQTKKPVKERIES